MSSGVQRAAQGSVVGTGSAINVRTVGFRPSSVKLFNVTGLVIAEWKATMADASLVKQVTDGTISFPTTLGITPLSNGFTIGADTDVNVAAETIHWEARE